MARKKMVTSSDMRKMRVMGGKRGTRRIGKVRSCVFHPSERRCIGFIVKRPDFLWMFHRKDLFVALDGFDLVDGRICMRQQAETTGPAACRRLGLNWDDCVIWEGMPLMDASQTAIGYVGNITFSLQTGEVESVEASNGATAKYLLGTLEVPAEYIKGFKKGIGSSLTVKDDSRDLGEGESFLGAILVSDEVWELSPEGGWAEAAGELTAKAGARIHEATESAKPKVQEMTHAAGEAINKGAFAAGKQVAASKGMFASFKEEYNKARFGDADDALALSDDEDEDEELLACDADDYEDHDEEASEDVEAYEDDEYDEDDDEGDFDDEDDECEDEDGKPASRKPSASPGVKGMFAAFKEEYDKARYEE